MIGRVYRGARVAGLVRYLWGPGRHNEHIDPHLVACWGGSQPAVLADVEPALLVPGRDDDAPARRDFTSLVAELEAPLRLREALSGTPAGPRVVWHCPLRAADTDRELTDAQWAEVAEDLLRRTGLDPAAGRNAAAGANSRGGQQAGCRWVAVRHDAVSIHVVVLLAREDGSAANPRFDYRRVRETCLAAEQRYELQVTAPIDGTAVPAVSRAETEKAGRAGADSSPRTRGSGEQARVALRREVRRCAVAAGSEAEFLTGLRRRGLIVRERHSTREPDRPPGSPTGAELDNGDVDVDVDVTGYAVGLPGDRDAAGEPVLYSGGRLGPDLTLPRLRQRWSDGSCTGIGRGDRVAALQAAGREANAAQLTLRHLGRDGIQDEASRATQEGLLAAAGDALVAAAVSLEGPLRGPLTRAAAHFERAGRLPGRTLHASVAGHALSRAARDVARAGAARPGAERQAALDMVHALVRLTEAVARLHHLRNRPHAAQAAALSATALQHWQHQAAVHFAGPPTRPAPRRALPSEPLASPRAAPRGRGGNS